MKYRENALGKGGHNLDAENKLLKVLHNFHRVFHMDKTIAAQGVSCCGGKNREL